MNKIGMIGGTGPESTIDYYKRLISLYQQKTGGFRYPEIVISSIDMTAMLNLVEEKRLNLLTAMLAREIRLLAAGGASFAFFSANTPHIVFDQVQRLSPIPLVSIVEATRDYAVQHGFKRLGLLGTFFTMQSQFYQDCFNKNGITLIVPHLKEQQLIQDKLMNEIEKGIFLDSTRNNLLDIIQRMVREDSIQGIILGCTELPLILTKDKFGIPFLNTTQIHVERILDYYLPDKTF